ncbi:NHL repeat-containing protein [Effusibacillus lacus]|uniref:6-bladed beta-propeller n=1 Tax=Effusibacillus lacus TaxID=1348429 RepID=A0A292YR27_9BACL|nr:NHL repeat-containing protein [Effusibacillus lacus]TCS76121.1 NHL repeat-containing protein [Effusibacillus lacus]GAX91369.1 hypothetical protein EFBL_3038 [Effusibacillus lacus]
MRVRNLVFLMLAVTVLAVATVWFRIGLATPEAKKLEVPGIGEFAFEQALYGQRDRELRNPIDLAVGSDGTVFVTDSDNHRIQVFDGQGEYVLHFGEQGQEEGKLNYPVGIALDSKQNIYVVEVLNQRISVFDRTGKFLKVLTDKKSAVKAPTAIAIDPKDQIYVVDKSDSRIKKLSPDGDLLLSFGGLGGTDGFFQYPLGLTVNSKEEIIVCDTGNSKIQVFDKEGKFKYSFAGNLQAPSGVGVDQRDRMYVTDPLGSRIFIFSNLGEQQAVIGEIGVTTDKLYFPEGVEIKQNRLYIADKGNNRVVIYRITEHQ